MSNNCFALFILTFHYLSPSNTKGSFPLEDEQQMKQKKIWEIYQIYQNTSIWDVPSELLEGLSWLHCV